MLAFIPEASPDPERSSPRGGRTDRRRWWPVLDRCDGDGPGVDDGFPCFGCVAHPGSARRAVGVGGSTRGAAPVSSGPGGCRPMSMSTRWRSAYPPPTGDPARHALKGRRNLGALRANFGRGRGRAASSCRGSSYRRSRRRDRPRSVVVMRSRCRRLRLDPAKLVARVARRRGSTTQPDAVPPRRRASRPAARFTDWCLDTTAFVGKYEVANRVCALQIRPTGPALTERHR